MKTFGLFVRVSQSSLDNSTCLLFCFISFREEEKGTDVRLTKPYIIRWLVLQTRHFVFLAHATNFSDDQRVDDRIEPVERDVSESQQKILSLRGKRCRFRPADTSHYKSLPITGASRHGHASPLEIRQCSTSV